MNIIGDGFLEPINSQVVQRQKIYGSGYANGTSRSHENLLYLNANTSWCKLVSSVNIVDEKIIQNQSIANIKNAGGNGLARQFVLFNGVQDIDLVPKASIDTSKSLSGDNRAYGIGGNNFGLRPMMGIKSAEIKHENRGSIRRATVQIKAFNKVQFDIIDTLYLRLGFDILLEWGHTMWYDNKGELHKGSDHENSLAKEFLDGKGSVPSSEIPPPPTTFGEYVDPLNSTEKLVSVNLTYDTFLQLIQKQRLKSCGNYDAMFAKVVNYHWSFLPDGSYDITLDLVSIGDIVESFKVNILNTGITNAQSTNKETDVTKLSDKELITLYADKSSIGQWFYTLMADSNTQKEAQLDKTTGTTKDQRTVQKIAGPNTNVNESGVLLAPTGPKE
jgi:hypothetical protein